MSRAPEIDEYHRTLAPQDREICDLLATAIEQGLPEASGKVWHAHPVWFLDGNPIVGYHRLKKDVRLLFWSGQSFDEPGLTDEGTFKAAEAHYSTAADVDTEALARWLAKARDIQWDYEHIRQSRGDLQKRTSF
jgi:hypothetical protein